MLSIRTRKRYKQESKEVDGRPDWNRCFERELDEAFNLSTGDEEHLIEMMRAPGKLPRITSKREAQPAKESGTEALYDNAVDGDRLTDGRRYQTNGYFHELTIPELSFETDPSSPWAKNYVAPQEKDRLTLEQASRHSLKQNGQHAATVEKVNRRRPGRGIRRL